MALPIKTSLPVPVCWKSITSISKTSSYPRMLPGTFISSWIRKGSGTFQVPDFIGEELVRHQQENNAFFSSNPNKKKETSFSISSHGTIKTKEALNAKLKSITRENGLPSITMSDLSNMFVWFLIQKNCSLEKIRYLNGGVQIGPFLVDGTHGKEN